MDKINPLYTNKAVLEKMNKTFTEERIITLGKIFTQEFFTKLQQEIKKLNFSKSKDILSHSYSTSKVPKSLQELFSSKDFLSFVSKITGKKMRDLTPELFSFSWKDYTIIHDTKKQKSGIDLIFDFTEQWSEEWGGQVIYVDGSGDYLPLPVRKNSLSIVKRGKNVRKFVEYVNHHAKGKRLLVFTS